MGLNFTERCDMITYWMPMLEEKLFVKIGFINIYEEIVGIKVRPSP